MNPVFIIALTLVLEAGNQDEAGMRAVASVIHHSSVFPCGEAYANECLRPRRYSCWNATIPSMDMVRKYSVRPEWQIAIKIAKQMASGSFRPDLHATHFCRTDAISHTGWTNDMEQVAVIGSHSFFRRKEQV